jgi:hypothetical protein
VEVGRFDAEQAGGLAQVALGPVDSLMDHPFFSRFGRLSGDPINVEVWSAREWSQGANLFGQVRPFTGLDEGFLVERMAQVFRSRSARNCVSLSPHSVCLIQKRCATLIVAHRPCVKQMPPVPHQVTVNPVFGYGATARSTIGWKPFSGVPGKPGPSVLP